MILKNINISLRHIFILLITSVMIALGSFSPALANNKSDLCRGANLTLEEKVNGRNINCGTDAEGNRVNNRGTLNNVVALIINILSFIVGILAVIMIIWGGAKFMTSAGDTSKVASARNAVIYALIGLIIVALAQFIVRFVLTETAGTAVP